MRNETYHSPATVRCCWSTVAFVILLCGVVTFLSSAASAEPNIMVRQLNIDVTIQPDGRYTKIFHMERSATNATAADRIGQFAIPFNPSLGRLDIIEAYTLKADGTRKNVDVSAIRDQLAPGVPNLPMFFDVQQKIVVFPDVAVGDTEVPDRTGGNRPPVAAGTVHLGGGIRAVHRMAECCHHRYRTA